MEKLKIIYLLVFLFFIGVSYSQTQPTSITNKLYLSPFYRDSMIQNTNYTYSVLLESPDGMSKIKSAILTLDAWIQPTRTAFAWVNGIACNTPSYTISTTYATSGKGHFIFDCSNAVRPNQVNYVTFRITGGNIGSNTAYIEVTYENDPKGKVDMYGTEYYTDQNAKLWLQLLDNNNQEVNNAVCYLDVYNPDNTIYFNSVQMSRLGEKGIFYYDFFTPTIEGVYPAVAQCYYTAIENKYYPSEHKVNRGTTPKITPYNFYDENGNNRTNLVAVAEDGLAHSRNIDGIGRAQRIFSDLTLYNGDVLLIRVYGDVNGKSIIFSNSGLTTIYASQPITTSYAYYYVTLSNIPSGGITQIYASDGTQAGAFVVTWDFIQVIRYSDTTLDYSRLVNQDGNYVTLEETSPDPRKIDVVFNITNVVSCLNISEDLLTGVNLYTYAKFDSVDNDDITISLRNYTSNSWITLSNKILEGNLWRSVSNTLNINNISKSGIYNVNGGIQIRFTDTNLTDTINSQLLIDQLYFSCNQLTNPQWKEVKGSSELHISRKGDYIGATYHAYTLCGDEETDSNNRQTTCAVFMNNESFWNYTWGYIYDKIVFINFYNSEVNDKFIYETSLGQDCTSVIDILKDGTSILNEVTFSVGNKDNCLITIPVKFQQTDREFSIEIFMDNYMKWEVERAYQYSKYFKLVLEGFCRKIEKENERPFQIPFTGHNMEDVINNPIYLGCWQALDDFWWFEYFYNQSKNYETTGEYESYLTEVRFYYPELKDHAQIVQTISEDITSQLVRIETNCKNEIKDYSCSLAKPSDSYFSSAEGYIFENITITNIYNTHLHTKFEYETPSDVDCTAVLDIYEVRNNTIINLSNKVTYKLGSKKNCIITLPIDLDIDEPKYNIYLFFENYILWNMLQMTDKVNSVKDNIISFCNELGLENGYTYDLPIKDKDIDYLNNTDLLFCYRALDDIYWWDYYSNEYEQYYGSEIPIGLLEQYYVEYLYFYPFIIEDNDIINIYKRNKNQLLTLSLVSDIVNNTHIRVWNYTNRTLTYYPMINKTEIAEEVWSWDGIIQNNLLTRIAEAIWNFAYRYIHGEDRS